MRTIELEMSIAGEYAGTAEAMKQAIEGAVADGLTIILGEPNTLLLDLDDGVEINQAVLEQLWRQFGETTEESWVSRSGTGRHVVLRFHEDRMFSHAEALALEGALGSDPKRVLFGIARLKFGVENPRMLWRPGTPVEAPQDEQDRLMAIIEGPSGLVL